MNQFDTFCQLCSWCWLRKYITVMSSCSDSDTCVFPRLLPLESHCRELLKNHVKCRMFHVEHHDKIWSVEERHLWRSQWFGCYPSRSLPKFSDVCSTWSSPRSPPPVRCQTARAHGWCHIVLHLAQLWKDSCHPFTCALSSSRLAAHDTDQCSYQLVPNMSLSLVLITLVSDMFLSAT